MYFRYDICYTKCTLVQSFAKALYGGPSRTQLYKLVLIVSWFVELYWKIKVFYVCLQFGLKVKIFIYLIFASTSLLTNVLAIKICYFMLFHDYTNLEFDVQTKLLTFSPHIYFIIKIWQISIHKGTVVVVFVLWLGL